MTECIPSTCSLLNTPYKRFRRLSITQGTISSRAKEVRSSEVFAGPPLLKKKSSTSQLSVRTVQPKKTPRPQDIRPLRATNKSVSNFNPVRLRLDEKKNRVEKPSLAYFEPATPKTSNNAEKALPEDSPADISPAQTKADQERSETEPSPFPSHHRQLQERLFQDLMVGIRAYTRQIQALSHTLLFSLSSSSSETLHQDIPGTPASQIQICQRLMAQQQQWLSQLEKTTGEEKTRVEPTLGWLQQLKSSILNPPEHCPTTVSVQGFCETAEASLVPVELLPKEKKGKYSFQYKLDLTEYDRRHLFALLPEDQWQKDAWAKTCQFDSCRNTFGLFQRKHHCRSCGGVYCNTHTLNKLPLFTLKNLKQPILSRTCDTCCFKRIQKESLTQSLS
ncbi:hypothetical protein BY458DRAFT_515507 [Sporodiniella umbellata]|nr:hypothetical protein BY458DRAFT_515507 [Sporodiniella umbellata]